MDRTYLFRLKGDGADLRTSTEAAAVAIDRLAGRTEALQREQGAAAAAADKFIQSLQRQAQAVGRTETELLGLRAAELGVADAAKPLIAQIEALNAARAREAEATQRSAAVARALENIRTAAANADKQAYQAAQRFVDGLQAEAEAAGKTRAQLLELQAAKLGVSAQAAPFIQRLQAGEQQLGGFRKGAKLTSLELQQVAFQLNDFGVQVASGGNPIIALVQQGSQLSGTFGGVGNAARALFSLITPGVLLFGGLAAAIGLVGTAYYQGQQAQLAFERTLQAAGNAAGATADRVDALARSIEASTRATAGAARDAVQAVIATGRFGPQELEAASRAVAAIADRTGQTADAVAKDLEGLTQGAAKFAAERNKSLNFLTGAQYAYIRSLELEGKTEQARIVILDALSQRFGQKVPTELGLLEKSLEVARKAASAFWSDLLNLGKPDTLDQQLAKARQSLADAERRLKFGGRFSAPTTRTQAEVDAAKQEVENIMEQQRLLNRFASQQADAARQNAADIADQQSDRIEARLALQKAGFERLQAAGEVARSREAAALEQQHRLLIVSEEQYIQQRYDLDRRAAQARIASIDEEIKLERQRKPEGSAEEIKTQQIQQEARLVALGAQRVSASKELVDLDSRRLADLFALRQAEEEYGVALAQNIAQRRGSRTDANGNFIEIQALEDLRTQNLQINLDLIRDDRARGEAQIALEVSLLKQRIDFRVLDADEQKQIEDELVAYRLGRQRQLTEQLKPEYQRMLEDWRNVSKLMEKTSDQFQTNFLRQAEDTFVRFVQTGKLSFKEIGNLALETVARFTFQKSFGQLAGQAGNALARLFGFGGGTNGGGIADTATKAASTAAETANTGAVAANTLATQVSTNAVTSMGTAAYQASIALARLSATSGADTGAGLFGQLFQAFTGSGGGAVGDAGQSDLIGAFDAVAAKGMAFNQGEQIYPFAAGAAFNRGRLTNGPETFAFRDGGAVKRGLRGEAGTEAIFPLVRGANGGLGIQAVGGAGAGVENNIYIIGAPSEPRIEEQRNSTGGTDTRVIFNEIEQRLAGRVAQGNGPLASAIGGRFNANPIAGSNRR